MSLFNVFKNNSNYSPKINVDSFIESLKINSKNEIPKSLSKRDLYVYFENKFDKAISTYDLSNSLTLSGLVEILAIDDTNKIFYIVSGKYIFKFQYSKLSDIEISNDTKTYVSGKGLSTLAGGLAFGLPGAIVGSSGKRKVKTKETRTYFKLILNDLNTSVLNLTVENIVRGRADEFLGALNYILNNK